MSAKNDEAIARLDAARVRRAGSKLNGSEGEARHSVDAEQNTLGSILADAAQWERVAPLLAETDFFRADHRLIWRAIATLRYTGRAADVVTVTEHLKLGGELNDAGGAAYINTLAHDTALPSNAPAYAEIVKSHAQSRTLAELVQNLACLDGSPADKIRTVRELLQGIERGSRSGTLIAVEIDEFLQRVFPPQELLLDPIIPRQGLVMIHAPRGVGKTQVSVGIAVAVSSGGTFLQWSAKAPAGVLLIDGEMPANVLQERLARAVKMSQTEPSSTLRIVTPDVNRERGMPDLSSAEGQAAVDALVTEDIALIIVDNLSSLNRSGVENESESWTPLQTWALRHRAAGRSVLFIHHSGKGGAQRGTSRREDVLDTVIALRRPADYLSIHGARFEVHIEKGRSIFGDKAAAFEAKLEQDARGHDIWTTVKIDANHDSRIKEMSDNGMKPNDIAAELRIDRSTVYRRIKKLTEPAGNGHA